MNYELTKHPSLKTNECLVLGFFSEADCQQFSSLNSHQSLLQCLFSKLKKSGDIIWQGDIDGHSLLLIHCGKKNEFTEKILSKILQKTVSELLSRSIRSATVCLPPIAKKKPDWQLQQMLLQLDAQVYQLLDFKTHEKKPHALKKVDFYLPEAQEAALKKSKIIAEAINFTRTLANLPSNVCTPTFLAHQAIELAQEHQKLTSTVLGPSEMQAMGMNALLAVAQGSKEEARLIEVRYDGAVDIPPVVLVGKGITFDSGGLSIKQPNCMDEMKYDMAGAAAVLGTLKACAQLKLPINVIGLVASAENMPSGSAIKPGDIVTSMSGQTIEVLNTDAEGRLVLADALTYAERFKPKLVIDVATLTGSIVIALGSINTGFMTEDEEIANWLMLAAKESQDKAWRMPLEEAYQDALTSPLADMINASFTREAGAITGACFLSRFTKKYRWAHLDIAGTSWVTGAKRNATGRPVALLIQFLDHVLDSR